MKNIFETFFTIFYIIGYYVKRIIIIFGILTIIATLLLMFGEF